MKQVQFNSLFPFPRAQTVPRLFTSVSTLKKGAPRLNCKGSPNSNKLNPSESHETLQSCFPSLLLSVDTHAQQIRGECRAGFVH